MIEAIFGVCWSGPASPVAPHSTGDHDTKLAVVLLDEMFPLVLKNVTALSVASPSMVSTVPSELVSST